MLNLNDRMPQQEGENMNFRITYDGKALQEHEFDVKVLAPALLAIGELIESSNRALNPESVKVAVKVKGSFKTGSFNIDFTSAQSFYSTVMDLLGSKEVVNAVTLLTLLGFIKGGKNTLISVLKWIKGRTIRHVEVKEKTAVIHIDNEQLEIERELLELLRNYNVRKALEDAIQPLENEGIDTFAVGDDSSFSEIITQDEQTYFIAPPPATQELGENIYPSTVQIERIEFAKDNKWRFSDGSSSFYATITDELFLRQIANDEISFSMGDVLSVKIKSTQRMEGDKLKAEYQIIEVIEHRKAMKQINLPY